MPPSRKSAPAHRARRRSAAPLHLAPPVAEAVRLLLETIRRVGRRRGIQLIEAIGNLIAAEPRQVRARRAP